MSTRRSTTRRPSRMPPSTLVVAVLAVTGAIFLALPVQLGLAQSRPVLVFAAASLKNALDDFVAQYPVALRGSANADASSFLRYLRSRAARLFWEQQGFTVLK